MAGAFFFGAAMVDPSERFEAHHSTTNEALGEFLHVWIAYISIICLIPGVFAFFLCAAVGSLFALIINPWRASVYLGASIEGIKRTVKACAIGVLQ